MRGSFGAEEAPACGSPASCEPADVYRGYRIHYDPPPIPIRSCDWQFFHEDYDGPEDGRCGFAGSLADAKAEIDMLEDD